MVLIQAIAVIDIQISMKTVHFVRDKRLNSNFPNSFGLNKKGDNFSSPRNEKCRSIVPMLRPIFHYYFPCYFLIQLIFGQKEAASKCGHVFRKCAINNLH